MKEAGRQEEGVRRQRKMEEKEGSRNSKDDNCRTAGKARKCEQRLDQEKGQRKRESKGR